MAARAARAREERIEGIAQRAVRRVMHSGLLRGWTSWFDAWGEKARTRPAPRTPTPYILTTHPLPIARILASNPRYPGWGIAPEYLPPDHPSNLTPTPDPSTPAPSRSTPPLLPSTSTSSTQVRLRRLLAASVARMQRPMLVALLSRWKHSWGEAEKRAGRLSGMSQVAGPDPDAAPKPIIHTDPFAGSNPGPDRTLHPPR